MAVVLVTFLGEPKKYRVLGTSRREAGTTKMKRGEGFILWTNGGAVESRIDEPKKSSPAGFQGLVEAPKRG
jgi:hypothetical protein